MSNCGLQGPLSIEAAFGNLQHLDLSNNNLTGPLPPNLMDAF